MTLLPRIIGQLFLILLGYAVSVLAASAFIHLILLGSVGFSAEEAQWLVMGSIIFSVPLVALFIAYFAFIPAAVAIGIAEIAGARDWLYYAIVGGIVGACVIALFWYSMPSPILFGDMPPPAPNREPFDNPYVLVVVIGGGMVGGIFYWLVAGRLAGDWRGRATSPARSGS